MKINFKIQNHNSDDLLILSLIKLSSILSMCYQCLFKISNRDIFPASLGILFNFTGNFEQLFAH